MYVHIIRLCTCPTDCTLDVIKEDIVFVIDTSSSIGSRNFQRVREFVNNVTVNLKLHSPESSVGIILYGDSAQIYFNLTMHPSLATLSPAINQIPYNGSSRSDIVGALQLLLYTAMNGTLGLRSEASNIAVVITDGSVDCRYGCFNVEHYSDELHNIFDVYAVGYAFFDSGELNRIASSPQFVYCTKPYYIELNFENLQKNLTDQLCSGNYTYYILILYNYNSVATYIGC